MHAHLSAKCSMEELDSCKKTNIYNILCKNQQLPIPDGY